MSIEHESGTMRTIQHLLEDRAENFLAHVTINEASELPTGAVLVNYTVSQPDWCSLDGDGIPTGKNSASEFAETLERDVVFSKTADQRVIGEVIRAVQKALRWLEVAQQTANRSPDAFADHERTERWFADRLKDHLHGLQTDLANAERTEPE